MCPVQCENLSLSVWYHFCHELWISSLISPEESCIIWHAFVWVLACVWVCRGREVNGAHLVDMSKFLRLVRREVRSKQALSSALAAQHSASCTCRWCPLRRRHRHAQATVWILHLLPPLWFFLLHSSTPISFISCATHLIPRSSYPSLILPLLFPPASCVSILTPILDCPMVMPFTFMWLRHTFGLFYVAYLRWRLVNGCSLLPSLDLDVEFSISPHLLFELISTIVTPSSLFP